MVTSDSQVAKYSQISGLLTERLRVRGGVLGRDWSGRV